MASIVKLGKGKSPLRAIDFVDPLTKKRKRVRLGKVSHDDALEYKRWIERLVSAKLLNQCDVKANEWLAGRHDEIHKRIARAGLCPSRTRAPESPGLAEWIDRYLGERHDLKPASRKRIELTADRLKRYFGEKTAIGEITPSMAHEWRATLYTPLPKPEMKSSKSKKKKRKTIEMKSRLSEASVRTHCRNVKSMFTAAVDRELIRRNPFKGLKSSAIAADRDHYIDAEQTAALLEAAPMPWRVLIGLARLAGLRVPSESHILKWGNIDFERRQLTVYAPKTDSYRKVPITPELLAILTEAHELAAESLDSVPPASSLVVSVPRNNRHRMLKALLTRTGIKAWGDLFQTMRRSCETDFARHNPQHAVSSWIGHSMKVSERN